MSMFTETRRISYGFDSKSLRMLIILIMLAYLFCAAYTRMTMNESFHPVTRRALQSQMSNASLKTCVLRHVLNFIVADIDLRSFGKLFHEAGPAYEKARSAILWRRSSSS